MKGRILIVDDERHLRKVLAIMLTSAGYEAEEASSGEEGLKKIAERRFDAVISDIRMPGLDGLSLLARIKETEPDLPVIMITAFASVESAVEAMKAGASDYVSKPFNEEQILIVLDKVLERRRILAENRRLRREVSQRYDFSSIITASPAMAKVLDVIRKVAETKSTVLIQGESGTGKELLARAIHYNSPRKEAPFIAVNCGAIPATLMESEFFGHVKGAFTGAERAKEGLFAAADGGTLFLDEVGELPLELQVKLLRVLQEEEIRPVGDTKNRPVDVRLVAATNQDLEAMIAQKTFRDDLFYRLAVIRLLIPPLRERPEDVPLLANHFVAQLAAKHGRAGASLTDEALIHLTKLPWPGNVRELMNVIEQALLLSDGPRIGTAHLPPLAARSGGELRVTVPRGVVNIKDALAEITAQAERTIIAQALEAEGGNRTRAAEAIGLSRRALINKIKEYGL